MKKPRYKFLLSLVLSLALVFGVSSIPAFAAENTINSNNYQVKQGVVVSLDRLTEDSTRFIGKLSIDTTKNVYSSSKFALSYTLDGVTTNLGDFPSETWMLKIDEATNYTGPLTIELKLYDINRPSYYHTVTFSFDLRQYPLSSSYAPIAFNGNLSSEGFAGRLACYIGSYTTANVAMRINGSDTVINYPNQLFKNGYYNSYTLPSGTSMVEITFQALKSDGSVDYEIIRTYKISGSGVVS